MNANELLAYNQGYNAGLKAGIDLNAEPILRQQQAEIEALKTHPVKEQGNPVAWRSQDPDGYWSVYQSLVEGAEPLYTGFKQLTDEGKLQFGMLFMNWNRSLKEPLVKPAYEQYVFEQAIAILRKAQSTCNGFCGEYECKENQSICKRKASEK